MEFSAVEVGVVLAAGKGSRMLPFSATLPKALLPVGNRPLIERQIRLLRNLGIRKVVLVVGYLGEAIRSALGDGAALGVQVCYVEQKRPLGIAHALSLLRGRIETPFLLFLGDIYFEAQGLDSLLQGERPRTDAAVLAVRRDSPRAVRKNFEVHLDHQGLVRKVVEKPRVVKSLFKGCGVYLFQEAIFDAIARTRPSSLRGELELTDAIQVLIDEGRRVSAAEVIRKDINLSFPADLLRSNLSALEEERQPNLIAADARLHERAEVHNSVIGPGAVLEGPLRLADSLVLAGSRLKAGENLRRVIVTPDGVLSCFQKAEAQGRIATLPQSSRGGAMHPQSRVELRALGEES
ncbi:MAG TPA: sugar phosphate nucleotidyltransferase [Acidobacteriota bacterium]|nr:sugar phosphate nucleotidyltransferase [Acidobacteriota bacterium]